MAGNGTGSTAIARRARHPLLSSCAIGSALVATGHALPVRAQSFQGTVIGAPIGATVNNGVPGQTTVTVTAPTAIVNWRPNDTSAGAAPITFQGPGTTATFQSIGDFAILNRIVPSGAAAGRSVLLNGTINSLIGSGTSVQGGTVWFYSPNGLLIGSQAVINVGSLGLSALDVTDNDFLNGDNAFSFSGPANSRAAVTISGADGSGPGAMIDATGFSTGGSYVALVAPRIKMGGTVNVDGSAAYVAAEAADISIDGGLFDIAVTSGSAVDPGGETTLDHDGTTTGPTPSGSSQPRAIYMVAIPKNDAVTMLVGGNVGYAVDASVTDNGDVILSAGRNIESTAFGSIADIAFTTVPTSAAGGSIQINGGLFSSDTRTSATLDLNANGGPGASLSFLRLADLHADRNATLRARANETVSAAGSLFVVSDGRNLAGVPTPGAALIDVLGGATLTGQDVSVTAFAGSLLLGAGSLTGGSASFQVTDGTVNVAGLGINADASAGSGTGQGGTAQLLLNGGTFNADSLSVSATGGSLDASTGGAGRGGTASIAVNGGALVLGSTFSGITVNAGGFGGGVVADGGTGGIGQGGTASVSTGVRGGVGGTITTATMFVGAHGAGGGADTEGVAEGVIGGTGTGGTASLTVGAGTVQVAADLTVSATGFGADGTRSFSALDGGAGGAGNGGTATITLSGGNLNASTAVVEALGIGGNGGRTFEIFEFGYGTGTSANGGVGGNGTGGRAVLLASTGTASGSSLTVNAAGRGGIGGISPFASNGDGGAGIGGLESAGKGAILATSGSGLVQYSSIAIDATGTGGDAGTGYGDMGVGGDGTGGLASLDQAGNGITVLDLTVNAFGQGGDGNELDGGTGRGGTARLRTGAGTLSVDNLFGSGGAEGGAGGLSGSGGDAFGGATAVIVENGTFIFGGDVDIAAVGQGGFGFLDGGDAVGGDASFTIRNGGEFILNSDGDFVIRGEAAGGLGSSGAGGSATGGSATLLVDNAQLTIGEALFMTALGAGRDGIAGTGSGTGGDVVIGVANGGELTVNGDARARANGTGGAATSTFGTVNGGFGFGGTVDVDVGEGSFTALQGLTIQAFGTGGAGGTGLAQMANPGANGGAGGSARGGAVTVSTSDIDSVLDLRGLFVDVNGLAANGADGSDGTTGGVGGAGGSGIGGTFSLTAALGTVDIFSIEGTSLDVDAVGAGGIGGFGGDGSNPGPSGGAGGNGGNGTGGAASMIASGSVISTGDLQLDASGFGSDSRIGGLGGDGTRASFGLAGVGRGGKVLVRAEDADGETGSIDAGFASLRALGRGAAGVIVGLRDIGGRIDVNLGPASTGGINFFSLDVNADGSALSSVDSAISIFADTGAITVDSTTFVQGGDFVFLGASGTGQILIDGDLRVTSDAFIAINHLAQTATPTDTIVARSMRFTANQSVLGDSSSSLRADGDIEVFAGGAASLGSATAGDDILVDADSVLVTGTLTTTGDGFDGGEGNPAGSNVIILAQNDIDVNRVNAADLLSLETVDGDITGGQLSAGGSIEIFSGGSVDVDSAIAFETGYGGDPGDVLVSAVDAARIGQAQAVGDVDVDADTIEIGDVTAGNVIVLDAFGDVQAGNLIARAGPGAARFTAIEIETDGDVTVASALAEFGDIDIDISGSITAGDLIAGDSVRLLAGGPIVTGGLTGGTYDGVSDGVSGYLGSVGAGSLGSLDIESASARNDIAFATADTITTGPLTAGRDIGLLATGDITLASADAGGQFFVGNSSVIDDLGLLDGLEIEDLPTILATTPVPTEGGLFVPGSVTAQSIRVAAGGLVNIGAATAFGEVGYGGAPGDISILGGSISIDLADATGNIVLNTALGGDAELATPIIGRTIATGALTAGGAVLVDGLDSVSIGAIEADGDVRVVSATALNVGDVTGGNDVLLDGVDSVVVGDVTGERDVEIVTTIRTADIGIVRPRSISVGSAFAGDDLVIAGFGAVTAGAIGTTGTGEDGTGGLKDFYPDQPGSSVLFISEKGGQIASIDAADNVRAINVPQSIGGVVIGDGSGGLTIGSITAGGDVSLQSPNSAIVVSTDLAAGGLVTATSTAVTLNALGDLNLSLATASAGNIIVRAGGDLTVADAVATAAGSQVELAAGFRPSGPFGSDGDLILTGTASAFGQVRLDGGGDVTLQPTARARSDGQILIRSGDDIFVQAGSVVGLGALAPSSGGGSQGSIQAGGPADLVRMTAGVLRFGTANPPASGLATIFIDGVVDGLAIELASEGIEIGAQAQIGSVNTATLDFINNGATQTFIGGDNVGSNYVLANAELGRVRGRAIEVTAPNLTSSQTDTVVRALDLLGTLSTQGQLVGTGASFRIDGSGGDVRVEGAVALRQAGVNDSFGIRAGRIDVITPSGSIAITGAQDALAGGLQLEANTIFSGTEQARTDIAALLTVDSKNSRLGQSDGLDVAEGFLQANRIEFRAADGLYIQNTSAITEPGADGRAGFTAGLPGVFILTTSTSPTEIVINGRQVSTDGGFVTGDELIPFLSISGSGTASMASFDPRSTVNGCLIRGVSCSVQIVDTFPVQDVIDDVVTPDERFDGGDGIVQALNVPVIQMAERTTFDYEPVIEEPVTGTGNDDLLTSPEVSAGQTPGETGGQAGPDAVDQQVTSTRNDAEDDASDAVDQQVTSTRADDKDDEAGAVDQQVTSTRSDEDDEAEGGVDQQVTGTRKDDEQADQPK